MGIFPWVAKSSNMFGLFDILDMFDAWSKPTYEEKNERTPWDYRVFLKNTYFLY